MTEVPGKESRKMRMCRICLTNEDETGQNFASFFDDDCATVQKYIDLFGLEVSEILIEMF